MFICETCKQSMGAEQDSHDGSFPACSVLASILGALGAAVTGALSIVPIAVLGGALADTLRQCEICGRQIEKDEPVYQVVEQLDDEMGGQTYRPVGKCDSVAKPNTPEPRPHQPAQHQETPRATQQADQHSQPTLPATFEGQLQEDLVEETSSTPLTQPPGPVIQQNDLNDPSSTFDHAGWDPAIPDLSGLGSILKPLQIESLFPEDDFMESDDLLGPIDDLLDEEPLL